MIDDILFRLQLAGAIAVILIVVIALMFIYDLSFDDILEAASHMAWYKL